MSSKRWKAVEGELAKMFGSTRTPLSGGNSKHTRSDTLHKRYFVEIKHGDYSMIKLMYKIHKRSHITFLQSADIDLVMVQYSDIIDQAEYMAQKRFQQVFAAGSLYLKTKNYCEQEMCKIPCLFLHLKGSRLDSSLLITEVEYFKEISDYLLETWKKKVWVESNKLLQNMEHPKQESI